MKILKKIRFLIPIFCTFLIIGLFWFTKITMFKLYPPVVNFCIFMVFFISLYAKETIIQKFAKAIEGDLTAPILSYTRKLTYIWSVFLFTNFIISVITVFLPDSIWMIYNGFVSYILLGLFFAIEYIVRINFRRKNIS